MSAYPTMLAALITAMLMPGGARASAAARTPQVMPAIRTAAQFQIDDADPGAGVPNPAAQNQAPLDFAYYLQDLIERAASATGRGDHRAAIRYYRALSKAVPDRSVAWSKLCASLEAAGDSADALAACREALGRPGLVVNDYPRFVRLVLAKTGDLSAVDVEDVSEVIRHLAREPATRLVAHQLQCELGLRLSDTDLLETCTTALTAAAPDDARTISFQWALAIQKRDRDLASHLIDRARAAGVTADGIARMVHTTALAAPHFGDRLRNWRVRVTAVVLFLAGAAAFVVWRRRRQQRQTLA